jgi:hypothetical protein
MKNPNNEANTGYFVLVIGVLGYNRMVFHARKMDFANNFVRLGTSNSCC